MTVALFASGTQTATVTTEHFLSSPNVAGKFSLQVDLVNMAAGDVLEVRAYKMILASGTARVIYAEQISGAQPTDALIIATTAVPNTLTDANAVRFSIKQTFGTGRNFPWAVYNEDDGTADVTKSMGFGVMGYGIVTTGSTTTSVVSSSCTPSGSVADQFKNRMIIFTNATTTAGLRSVATTITASTNAAAPTFTVNTLPATPANGDTFVIV